MKSKLLVLLCCLLCLNAVAQNNDLSAIRNQCRNLLLSDTAYANERSFQFPEDVIYTTNAEGYYRSLTPDGTWKDLEYNRPDIPARWPPIWHLYRVMLLCKAYHKNTDNRYLTAIHHALAYYIQNDFKCNNWWQNEINVPFCFTSIMLMLDKDATPEELAFTEKLIPRAQQKNPVGQNKIWQHDIEARFALLHNDQPGFQKALQNLQSVITVSTGEGVQPDYSYQQHGPMLQFGNYGLHFVNSTLFWIKLTAGSAYAFSPEKQQIVLDYCKNGLRWTVFRGNMDITAVGRQIRPDFTRKRGEVMRDAFSLIPGIQPTYNPCDFLIDGISTTPGCTFGGNKGFWRSDYMVHLQHDQYMMSVKTNGQFVKPVESINGENLKGALLNDGVALIQRDGYEYTNLEAAWRWEMLPGTTTDTTWNVLDPKFHATSNQSGFVGQASDGTNGISAMYYNRAGLTAYKSYFFIDDMMVALGAGISNADKKHVITTINQRTYNSSTGKQLKGQGWFWHDNIGYFFPAQEAELKFRVDYRQGDWGGIDKASAGKKLIDSVGTWYISQAHSDKYVYMVKPNIGVVATHKMATHNPIKVLANSSLVQAVQGGNTIMAVFYRPGTLYITESQRIQTSQPCVFIYTRNGKSTNLSVSDPTRKLTSVVISVNGNTIPVSLPQGDLAGSTVPVDVASRN